MNRALAIKQAIQAIDLYVNGGKGSGNFGHAGRPGRRGGSGTGGSDPSVSRKLGFAFNKLTEAQNKADDLYEQEFEWAVQMTVVEKARQALNQTFRSEFLRRGLDMSKVTKDQLEWAEGNGPRDPKTGQYYSEPDLQKHKNSPEHKLHRQLTQDTLRASGIKELTLYRGTRKGEPEARGYTSFTTSKAVAGTFGHNIVTKKVKLKDIVSHHQVQWNSTYASEQEVVVDLH